MALKVSFVFFLCIMQYAIGKQCVLEVSGQDSIIFTKSLGSKTFLLSPNDDSFKVTESDTIYAHCPNGFSSDPALNLLELHCAHGAIYRKIENEDSSFRFERYHHIPNCDVESLFYEGEVKGCSNYGLSFGLKLRSEPVVFANVCYDMESMQANFIHYIAGIRRPIIEGQNSLNANNSLGIRNVLLDGDVNLKRNDSLIDMINEKIPYYKDIVQFQMDYLVPMSSLAGPFESYVDSFDAVNRIVWWKPLKMGNWREVEKAILNLSASRLEYEVFAGVAETVASPFNGKCLDQEDLTFETDGIEYNVPLYVWNYIRERGTNDSGVVIIGINTPFYPHTNKVFEICEDICHKVPWLATVNKLRFMPALGYIFCCRPNEISKRISNFPKMIEV